MYVFGSLLIVAIGWSGARNNHRCHQYDDGNITPCRRSGVRHESLYSRNENDWYPTKTGNITFSQYSKIGIVGTLVCCSFPRGPSSYRTGFSLALECCCSYYCRNKNAPPISSLEQVKQHATDSATDANNANATETRQEESLDFKTDKTVSINCNKKSNESQNDNVSIPLFDRVLVDSECSSDGALRHRSIEKDRQYSAKSTAAWDDTNMIDLVDLQKRLIENGYRLLKRGGIMIYSTCSLSSKQNEQVVS